MIKRSKFTPGGLIAAIVVAATINVPTSSSAAELKILVAKGTNVSGNTLQLTIIEAINSAKDDAQVMKPDAKLASPLLNFTGCTGTSEGNLNDELACAKAQLFGLRDNLHADLVILVVDQPIPTGVIEFDCGLADGYGSLPFVSFSKSNDHKAYSVVDIKCLNEQIGLATH